VNLTIKFYNLRIINDKKTFIVIMSSKVIIFLILSKLLNGNNDLIKVIYEKKEIVEKNETLLYHLINGIQTEQLYNYNIFSLKTGDVDIYPSLLSEKTYINNSSTMSQDDLYNKELDQSVLDMFQIDKIHYRWNEASSESLIQDRRWNQKVIIEALSLPNFIKYRNNDMEIIDPPLKKKINIINRLLKDISINYIELIKEEFKKNDIPYCILLNEDGETQMIIY